MHDDTIKVVAAQKSHLGEQMVAMNDIASRIKTQNNAHHDTHIASLLRLGKNVKEHHADTGQHFEALSGRIEDFKRAVDPDTESLQEATSDLDKMTREPLHGVAEDVGTMVMAEYEPTGETPEKQSYVYSSTLPSTESREKLLAKLQDSKCTNEPERHDSLPCEESAQSPPPKSIVFTDSPSTTCSRPSSRDEPACSSAINTLRELDVNVLSGQTDNSPSTHSEPNLMKSLVNVRSAPSLKRQATTSAAVDHENSKLPKKAARKTVASAYVMEGNENIPAANFSSSVGPAAGRRLRSHVVK